MLHRTVYAALVAVVLCASALSAAQSYPAKPVRMIVAYPAGGGTDVLARIVASKLGENLGQQVVIDNRGGAGGIVGTELAARSAPDGYTLLMGSVGPNAVVPAVQPKLSYSVADFAPVSLVATSDYLLVVHPSLPARSLKEFLSLARASPGKLDFASTGSLGGPHLAAELFKVLGKVNLVHVPYKGGAPQVTAVLSGEVSLAFASPPNVLRYLSAGKLRALGTTGPKRNRVLGDVPSIGEILSGYEVTQWYGVFVPSATPKAIVTKLNAEVIKSVKDPAVQEQVRNLGVEAVSNSPEAFGELIGREMAKWKTVIKTTGMPSE